MGLIVDSFISILSCQYKTSSANKLVDRKVHYFLLLRNNKYAKNGAREFVQLRETVKIECSENNTFTVFAFSVVDSRFETRSAQTKGLVFVNFSNTTRH